MCPPTLSLSLAFFGIWIAGIGAELFEPTSISIPRLVQLSALSDLTLLPSTYVICYNHYFRAWRSSYRSCLMMLGNMSHLRMWWLCTDCKIYRYIRERMLFLV